MLEQHELRNSVMQNQSGSLQGQTHTYIYSKTLLNFLPSSSYNFSIELDTVPSCETGGMSTSRKGEATDWHVGIIILALVASIIGVGYSPVAWVACL